MNPSQSRAWRNPHETEGYLVDYYSVLGVERGAPAETVQERYRDLMRQYHPDLLAQLGSRCPPEFKEIAERRSALFAQAYGVVGDGDKRPAYDRELAGWSGPLSLDGTPIISLFASQFNPLSLLEAPAIRDEKIERYRVLAEQMSGFNRVNHDELKKAVETNPNCPAVIRRSYVDSLERQEVYLALLQDRVEQELGVENRSVSFPSERLLEATESKLQTAKASVTVAVSSKLLQAAEGRFQLGGAKGEAISSELRDERALAVQKFSEAALSEANRIAERVVAIAREREHAIGERLQLVELQYDPPPTVYSGKVILVISVGQPATETVLSFELQGERENGCWSGCGSSDSVKSGQLNDAAGRAELASQGWNVIRVVGDGYPIRSLIERVLTIHTGSL